MYQFLSKNGQVVAFGVGLLLTIIFLISAINGGSQLADLPEQDPRRFEVDAFNIGIYAAIALVVIAFIAAIVFGIYHVARNPKSGIKFLIGIGALLVVFFIFYAMADGDVSGQLEQVVRNFERDTGSEMSPSLIKAIGGGIITTIVLAGIAAVALIIAEVRALFS